MRTGVELATARPLPRQLRFAVLAVIAVSHLFLLLHSQEPLRLNVGDPWSEANVISSMKYVRDYGFLETSFTDILDVGPLTEESYRYTHYPPLSEIIYGAIHKYLGVDSLGTFRLFAIGFSGLAMWLLFLYVRRLYDDSTALIATMLWSCNLLWMMYADMIHQAPVMQASAFLALWGLLRALDDPRPRYWAAAWIGSCACFLTSYDYWVFLPTAVLATVYLRRGNPLKLANLKPVVICASGCVAAIVLKSLFVIGAVGWTEFLADLHFQFLERSTSHYEQYAGAVIPTLVRRFTMVFTPLVWIVVVVQGWRFVRAPTLLRAIQDGTWLALPALAFFVLFSQLSASQMLTGQVALPFYAICSALLLVRLLDHSSRTRILAIAILAFVPAWGLFWMNRHERAFFEPDDVAKVKSYLDANDHNDYLVSNLMADGPVQAYLDRHYVPAFSSENFIQYHIVALDLMEETGRDYYHVLVFKQPGSRMIDKSLWPLALPLRRWSLTGAHLFWPKKGAKLIKQYDNAVIGNLEIVDAKVVVSTPAMDLYKVTRADVLRTTAGRIPDTAFIDFGSFSAEHHKLVGWSGQRWSPEDGLAYSSLDGYTGCPDWGRHWCRTVLTKRGVITRGDIPMRKAQFLIHGTNRCDGELVLRLVQPFDINVQFNGKPPASVTKDGRVIRVKLTAAQLVEGVNTVTLDWVMPEEDPKAKVQPKSPMLASAELRQVCRLEPAR